MIVFRFWKDGSGKLGMICEMKVIIHIGMHKTGSSSIQQTFVRLNHPNIEYVNWNPSGNHSDLFVLLFEDEEQLKSYQPFKARGPAFMEGLPALREMWQKRLSAQLSNAANKTVFFSGEDISHPNFPNAVPRLRNFFSEWTNEVSIIGYARPPHSFMVSAFQQHLKDGNIAMPVQASALPRYRTRFEKIDKVFGRKNVKIKEFSPDHLANGDVVQDVAREIGIAPLAEGQIIRTNESLSLEAAALLYVQRRFGRGFVSGFEGAQAANMAFIQKLSTTGSRKFAFSTKILAPVLEKERADIAWMEARLGHPFSDSGADHRDSIDSLDDLVDIALGEYDAVQHLLGKSVTENVPATIENLVRALEQLREQCSADALGVNVNTKKTTTEKGDLKMAAETAPPKATEEELHLRSRLARMLWHADNAGTISSDPAERKAAFDLVKQDYNRKALDLTRRLKNNNLKLVEIDPKA